MLWVTDHSSPAEAVKVARRELRAYEDAQMAAEALVDFALRAHAEDNITVTVVRLFAPRPEEAVARRFMRRNSSKGSLTHGSLGGTGGPNSFLQLKTPASFVRVVGGF